MEHIVPNVPLQCLQAILKELIQARDPDATFVDPPVENLEQSKKPAIGQ